MDTYDPTIENAVARPWSTRFLTRTNLYRVVAFLPIIVLTIIVIVYRNRIEDLSGIGIFGVFLVNVIGSGTFILPVPGIAAVFAAGAPWNPLLVGIAGALGSTIGEMSGYLAGMGAHSTVERTIGRNKWYRKVEMWIEKRGIVTIFVFAATPNPLFDVAGFAAGSLGYSFPRFAIACWAGKTIKYIAVAYAGHWGATAVYRFLEGGGSPFS